MRNQNLGFRTFSFLLILFLIGIFIGCDEATKVSVDERINMFFSDLNAGSTSTLRGDHISPKSSDYNSINSAFWTVAPWNNVPFRVNSSNIADSIQVSVDLTLAYGETTQTDATWTFFMDEEDDDFWLIRGIDDELGGELISQ